MNDSGRAIIDRLIRHRILENLYQGYEIKNVNGHYEIRRNNQFVSSADTESEAQRDIDKYLEEEQRSQKIMKEAEDLEDEESESSEESLDFSDKEFLENLLEDSVGSLKLLRIGRTISGVQANIEGKPDQVDKVHDNLVTALVSGGAFVTSERIFTNSGAMHKRLKGAQFRLTEVQSDSDICTVKSRRGGMEENMVALTRGPAPVLPGWDLQSE